jgi:two-component system NarL family response regulator
VVCDFSKIRLLLVDDNAVWRTFAIKHLNEAGLRTIDVAYDGVQGVFKARTVHPDLILMDVRLPHMTGIEAAAKMRDAVPAAKVVFVSGVDDPNVISAALNAGGVEYVLKSRAGRDLIPAIRRALGFAETA